ncbi:MAG: MerR family transcriptional regulator [Gaiellales bacterium]
MSELPVYRVAELARLSGVSVRTLHHYDEIGLLVPSRRTEAGYRLYTEQDLLRLQQILLHRELGLSLDEIRLWLDEPGFDVRGALRDARAELSARAASAERMVRAIDVALARLDTRTGGHIVNEPTELFDGFDPAAYEEEAEARWGDTASWAESRRRTAGYTNDDWAALASEQASIYDDVAALLVAGAEPSSAAAKAVAERHRLSIDRWFYPCSRAMHAELAAGYDADPRFAATMDRHGEGVTAFLAAAMRANASHVS